MKQLIEITMNTLIRKLCYVWILACLFSCSDDNSTVEVAEPACSITVDGQVVTLLKVDLKASIIQVSIEATTDWKMESDSEWCRVSNLSGKATAQGKPKEIEINIEKNTKETPKLNKHQ